MILVGKLRMDNSTDINLEKISQVTANYLSEYFKDDLKPGKHFNLKVSSEISIQLYFYAQYNNKDILSGLEKHLKKIHPTLELKISIENKIRRYAVRDGLHGHPNIKNIIAVGSGKGGVGKSTVAVNLALALQQDGAKVGILDADIYGPSQAKMLGATALKANNVGKKFIPVVSHGLSSMSIAYLIDENTPMIWRGPMVSGALKQLLNDTNWPELDYLIIDLPPGTGDIHLTLAQKVPVAGAVIVTTPQDIALLDARKAIEMFNKVSTPVLGLIENMSMHTCSNCGHNEHIFGKDGGMRISEATNTELFGSLPLDASIQKNTDSGLPSVVANTDSKIAEQYRFLARKTAIALCKQKRDLRISSNIV